MNCLIQSLKKCKFSVMLKFVLFVVFNVALWSDAGLMQQNKEVEVPPQTMGVCAYTLAEILIVMGVVGIVAMDLIPTLFLEGLKISTVTGVQRSYSIYSDGYNRALSENGTPDEWGIGAPGDPAGLSRLNDTFSKYFKLEQNCGSGTGCFPDVNYKDLNGKETDTNFNQDSNYTKFILVDGTSVALTQTSADCSDNWGTSHSLQNVCGVVVFDTNGEKAPNQFGEDFFGFVFTKFGLIPLGSQDQTKYSFEEYCNMSSDTNSNFENGLSCTAWVMQNGNMDYKKDTYLSWNGTNEGNSNGNTENSGNGGNGGGDDEDDADDGKSKGNCGNGKGKGGAAGSGLGNGNGNTCSDNKKK